MFMSALLGGEHYGFEPRLRALDRSRTIDANGDTGAGFGRSRHDPIGGRDHSSK
jgi:hypothetical protein